MQHPRGQNISSPYIARVILSYKERCCVPTTGKPASNFTIHGLWPNTNGNTFPAFCNRNSSYDQTKVTNCIDVTASKIIECPFIPKRICNATIVLPAYNVTRSSSWRL
ncbi:hypothetical protein M9H77_09979 [Catharanthus roseus]|uniref:Uncharacterized protein n=1 Tax=Catharanthus roseus TaxID=4058 RepID=A0ACC0C2B4_CATRO|nr:hypothetical protein M9H77_09979 [Catharanthus roseus]